MLLQPDAALGAAVCAALRGQVEKLGLSIGDEPIWAEAVFAETVDPFSQEINLIGKVADAVDYVIGGYYFQEKGHEDSPQIVDFVTAWGMVRSNPQMIYATKSSAKMLLVKA